MSRDKFLNFTKNKKIVIYGSGTISGKVINKLDELNIFPEFILETESTKKSFKNYKVFLLKDIDINFDEYIVILGFFNAYVDVLDLKNKLTRIGFGSIITFLDFYDFFPEYFGDIYWLTDKNYLKDKTESLDEVKSLLEDNKSKIIFEEVVKFRTTLNYNALSSVDLDDQYFPNDIPKWKEPVNFIDLGAFNGDTIKLLNDKYDINKIAAFEPDQENLQELIEFLKKLNKESIIFPYATSDGIKKMNFDANAGAGSVVSEFGAETVTTISIDQSLILFNPTLIKMDIEGSEHETLIGAEQTIKLTRPGLAICLYHKPEDLFKIPLLLKKWNLNYTFYLRLHCYSSFDLVLYAIPNK